MNEAPILTPVARGYSSKDYLNAEVILDKVRVGTSSIGNATSNYLTGVTVYVKRNPVKVGLITTGVVILVSGFIYRSQIAGQLRRWI